MAFRVNETTLPAFESVEFHGPGRWLRVLDATGPVAVAFDDEAMGDRMEPGQSVNEPEGFKKVRVTDLAGEMNAVRVVVSDGFHSDDRLQFSGVIDVRNVDAFYNSRVLAGVACVGGSAVQAVAGEYGFVELYNPLASGKNLIVTRALAALGAVGGLKLMSYSDTRGGSQISPLNKYIGGALPAGEMRVGSSPSYVGDQLYSNIAQDKDTQEMIRPDCYPFVVPPGHSIAVVGQLANTVLWSNFEWEERAR